MLVSGSARFTAIVGQTGVREERPNDADDDVKHLYKMGVSECLRIFVRAFMKILKLQEDR